MVYIIRIGFSLCGNYYSYICKGGGMTIAAVLASMLFIFIAFGFLLGRISAKKDE